MYGGMREYIGWSYGRLRMQGDMIFRSACKTQWSLQLSNMTDTYVNLYKYVLTRFSLSTSQL